LSVERGAEGRKGQNLRWKGGVGKNRVKRGTKGCGISGGKGGPERLPYRLQGKTRPRGLVTE